MKKKMWLAIACYTGIDMAKYGISTLLDTVNYEQQCSWIVEVIKWTCCANCYTDSIIAEKNKNLTKEQNKISAFFVNKHTAW